MCATPRAPPPPRTSPTRGLLGQARCRLDDQQASREQRGKEFARQRKGTPLWWGSCDALQTPDPLAPLHDIARSAAVGLRPLLERQLKGSALFGEVIRELQALGPALVVIEDAHWADESTLDLIKYLGRRIDRTRRC